MCRFIDYLKTFFGILEVAIIFIDYCLTAIVGLCLLIFLIFCLIVLILFFFF